MMPTDRQIAAFDLIYRTDLVYRPACHQLCGDGHCCHFSRYKATRPDRHVLVLLPGEYEYMRERGLLHQYVDHRHIHLDFDLDDVTLSYNALDVARSTPGCVCTHDLRPTLCRLYPLIPIYGPDGRVEGVDRSFALIEELEMIHGADRACAIAELPIEQTERFFTIANAIGQDPSWRLHFAAYRLVKAHCAEALRRSPIPKGRAAADLARAWHDAQRALMSGTLFDVEQLEADLASVRLGELLGAPQPVVGVEAERMNE